MVIRTIENVHLGNARQNTANEHERGIDAGVFAPHCTSARVR